MGGQRLLGGYREGSTSFDYFIDGNANIIRRVNEKTTPDIMKRKTLLQGNHFLCCSDPFESEEDEHDIDDVFGDEELDSWARGFAAAINEKRARRFEESN